jgi:hypothetical protein
MLRPKDEQKGSKISGQQIFVWGSFVCFVAWVLLIIAVQQSYGFGPFIVYPDIPHEGRYVFAGLVQLLTFTWSFMFVLKILHKADVSFLRVIHWPASMQLNADIRSVQIGRFAGIGSLIFLAGAWNRYMSNLCAPFTCVMEAHEADSLASDSLGFHLDIHTHILESAHCCRFF